MAVRKEEVRVTADVNNFVTKFAAAGRSADGFANRLEAADGRLAGLVQSGLALAPALAPIGAAAVPAIAGLATQLGIAALAAGATVLAFQGVGDAVKALDTFKTTPTAENFAKLQQAMDKLGPAGQEFVLTLQRMRPEVQRLQSLTEGGLFPGLTSGLDDLLRIAPQVEDVLFTVSDTLGKLSGEAGQHIASPEFEKFFNYLKTTAGPVLTEMGHTLGNFLEGTGNLILAFDPLARDFSTGLLDVSQSFREFTANLDGTQGFQDFIAYVEKSGPLALDALGSLANAIVQLVEAAAPVGTAVLPIISALADGLAAIADSPVGPVLISAAAAVGVLGRSLALLKIVGLRGGGDGVVAQALGTGKVKATVASIREASSATKELAEAEKLRGAAAARARDAQFALIPDSAKRGAVNDYTAAVSRQAAAEEKVRNASERRSAAMRATAGQVGRATAAVGGLVLATSGLADKTGLSNSASLALMGTIAGPYGAAIGGAVGFTQDLAAANNDLEDALKVSGRALEAAAPSFETVDSAIAASKKAYEEYMASIQSKSPLGALKSAADLVTHSSVEGAEKIKEQESAARALRQELAQLYGDLHNGSLALVNGSSDQIDQFMSNIAPALESAGLSFDDLATKPQAVARAVNEYSQAQKDALTDSDAVASAMDILSGDVIPGLTNATAGSTAIIDTNTQAVLDNIKAMQDQADAVANAYDKETAYQAALDEGKDRKKEAADIQQQINETRSSGQQQRADIRSQASQSSADTARQIADLRKQLAAAKTPAQRQSIQGRIADAQRNQNRDTARVQEQIADSYKNQGKTIADLQERLAEYANTLDKTTKAGRANRGVLAAMRDAYNNLDDQQKNAPGKYEKTRQALIKQAEQFGLTKKQAEEYIKKLGLQIPPRVMTKILLDKKKAEEDLKRWKAQWDDLKPKTVKLWLKIQQDHITGPTGKLDRASGGKPSATFADGGYTGDGARLEPAGIVHRGEFVVDAIRTREHRSLLNAIQYGSRMPGYASGGYVTGSGGLSSSDMATLVKALGSMQPRVGTQIVQPHNYNEFLRQQEANERLSSMGAVSFRG